MSNRGAAATAAAVLAVGAAAVGVAVNVSGNQQAAAVTVTESPLSNEVAATPMAVPAVPAQTPAVILDTFRQFLSYTAAATLYKNWVDANCGKANGGTPAAPRPGTDVAKWYSYRDAILRGDRPDPPPTMATAYGRSLVTVGLLALRA